MKEQHEILYRSLLNALLHRDFLKRMHLSKGEMEDKLAQGRVKEKLARKPEPLFLSAKEIISLFSDVAAGFGTVPDQGWPAYLCDTTVYRLFGEGPYAPLPSMEKGAELLWTALDAYYAYERENKVFSPTENLELLTEEETYAFDTGEEYRQLLKKCRKMHLYSFLKLQKEHTGYDTVGHVFGVHFVAMHVARQLYEAQVPVDLALISGAAFSHDIGKFGCLGEEAARIPYLHYYYTDKCLTRYGFPTISHIASNHSTWDLELENLSVESLLLIYADFRVKSRYPNGKEEIVFYSMDEAFDVILSKLDNVDAAKEARYRRVYRKIKDFEDYMKAKGVSIYLDKKTIKKTKWVDPALLATDQAVDRMKYLAISYNIGVMHQLRNELSFGDILEEARSDRETNRLRAYLSTLEEYNTYLTLRQKEMTLSFLEELLIVRDGDIRRQAAALYGKLVANYQEHYRKEMPLSAKKEEGIEENLALWGRHVEKIMSPGTQYTEQQRRWMGYSLKITLTSLLAACNPRQKGIYADVFFEVVRHMHLNQEGIFFFLDTVGNIPEEALEVANIDALVDFIDKVYKKPILEIKVACLVVLQLLTKGEKARALVGENRLIVDRITGQRIDGDTPTCLVYLLANIRTAMDFGGEKTARVLRELEKRYARTSELYRDNLKANTPWLVKVINIDFLMEQLNHGDKANMFFTATHLANLLKVSERITVRHRAGRGLLEITPHMELEQRNEIVVELMKGLELGNLQFSKYIPEYLGQIALQLHPKELDEIIRDMRDMLINRNDKTASVTMETVGVMLHHYPSYQGKFRENKKEYEGRRDRLLGMLLTGMASYKTVIRQEAFMVLGHSVFAGEDLSLEEKFEMFKTIYKKVVILVSSGEDINLSFFYNSAALNHIYRFAAAYVAKYGSLKLTTPERIAFFPGTFDPFSLSHKGIVTTIRDLGYEVYLAIDEFSWSKKTQPRQVRHNIISMTMANEKDVYVFPENIPINIANNDNMDKLAKIFPKKKLYLVMGSDVVSNASTYRQPKALNSIHTFNHLIFRRKSSEDGSGSFGRRYKATLKEITGKVEELYLPVDLEEISSTRIRNNIDENREISSLIDPMAQNYIYEYNLYRREPMFKSVANRSEIRVVAHNVGTRIKESILFLNKSKESEAGHALTEAADPMNLLHEFGNRELTAYIRSIAGGKLMIIKDFHVKDLEDRDYLYSLMMTEVFMRALKKGYTYAVFLQKSDDRQAQRKLDVLSRMGFKEIVLSGEKTGCYGVDMSNPAVMFHDMETVLKAPFDTDARVLQAVRKAQIKLQRALVKLFDNTLVLSVDTSVMNQKIIEKITRDNHVSSIHNRKGKRGPYMCVPFGKILNGLVVPNTVSKTLHIQKHFAPGLDNFDIKENAYYATIENQVKTIKSFARPVILVDDLLHKGYRMQHLDPLLKDNQVDVHKILVGVISGRGKDLMEEQGRDVESIYYLPTLKAWFVESLQYPFIGGDAIDRGRTTYEDARMAINMIMPYVMPAFLKNLPSEEVIAFSETCLENAQQLFLVLESVYQEIYRRKMTLKRVPEVIRFSMLPDIGDCLDYDFTLAPSEYIETDLERLARMGKKTRKSDNA